MGLVQIGGEIRATPLNQNFQYLDGKHLYGDDAAKPSPAQIGRLYVALDTGIIYADIGTAWIPVGGGSVPAHASTHATGGSDPLTPADIGAASQVDFDAHKAETSLKHIHEVGSNANGRYIRFDDGTQICYTDTFQITNIETEYGGFYRSDGNDVWTFPASFIFPPAIAVSSPTNTIWADGNPTSTNANIIAKRHAAESVARNYRIAAIGRWK